MSFAFLTNAYDHLTGRGAGAVTIPAMDGALRPNLRLETSDRIVELEEPDNLVVQGARALFSSGRTVFSIELGDEQPKLVQAHAFDCVITALAMSSEATIAVGLADGRIVFPTDPATGEISQLGGSHFKGPTALTFTQDGNLLVCLGSSVHSPDAWQRSLMNLDSTGSVWRVDLTSGSQTKMGEGMAYPYGVLEDQSGSVVVSESWRHRLVMLDKSGTSRPRIVLGNLPGYPARLAAGTDGGSWLAVAAPRSQLVELVLREPRFRRTMMAEIDDSSLWVAPALYSRRSFLEPMQGGSLKQMGILKPWSPTRSYGLVVRLDGQYQPTESLHSRSDGRHHGIRSCAEHDGFLISASGGGDALLRSRL
jgi:hypothetical protein